MVRSRRQPRIADARAHPRAVDDSQEHALAWFPFDQLGQWRTWARMVLGFALACAYFSLTGALAWLVVGLGSGTWGVPPGQGFHGGWPAYLLVLSLAGAILTPVLIMAAGALGYGAYWLGSLVWPLPD